MKHKSITNLFFSLMLVCFMTAAFKPLDAKAALGTYIENPTIVFDANSDTNPLIDVTSAIHATVTDIKVDGAVIEKSNYTVDANGDVNIAYEYLIQLPVGNHNFELIMSEANNPTGVITIPDTCKIEFVSDPAAGGTVELYISEDTYKEFGTLYYAPKGNKISFFARPSSGYSFDGYQYNDNYGYNQILTLTPTKDMKITVDFFKNTYKVETDVKACDFGKAKIGYSNIKEQVVKLTNMSTASFLLEKPELKNYEVEFRSINGDLPAPLSEVNPDNIHGYPMYPEDSVELVIRPKANLGAGKYPEDMAIVTIEDQSEGIIDAKETTHFTIPLNFEVYDDKAPAVDDENKTDDKLANADAKAENATAKTAEVKPVNSAIPKTGDHSHVVFYAALTILALMAATIVVVKRKNK